VTQWQILAKEPGKLAEFYADLFAWEVNANNALDYRMVSTGSDRGIGGGIWPAPPEAPSMVSLYVEVDDVAGMVKKATGLGAKVVIPRQMLPDGDEMAVILDIEGIPVGIFKPAQKKPT
jgi:predicted enzyme related to lactoylglutathione lyase